MSKKPAARWIALLAVALTGGIFLRRLPPEPVQGGKRLSVWLEELRRAGGDNDQLARTSTPTVLAVRAIGTNAIPWLLHELQHAPNPLARALNPAATRVRAEVRWFPFPETPSGFSTMRWRPDAFRRPMP